MHAWQSNQCYIGPPVTGTGGHRTRGEVDPFTVSTDENVDLLLQADQSMRRVAGVKVTRRSIVSLRRRFGLRQHRRAFTEQEIVERELVLSPWPSGVGRISSDPSVGAR